MSAHPHQATLDALRLQFKPHGYRVRGTLGMNGYVMLEHPALKRKVRFYPRTQRWVVWFNDYSPAAVRLSGNMPRGQGMPALLTHLVADQVAA